MIDSPAWARLTPARQPGPRHVRDAERTAVAERIAERCRKVLGPTGDGQDLPHLHPIG